VANVIVTGSGGALATAGIILGIYLGTMFISTSFHALSRTHGITEDRHWWSSTLSRSSSFFGLASPSSCLQHHRLRRNPRWHRRGQFSSSDIPLQSWVAASQRPFTAIALVVLALALYLLTPENYLTIPQALPGAIFFSVGWMTVTKLFPVHTSAYYDRYNATYLALASIIMLLTWMYLTCLLFVAWWKTQRHPAPRDRTRRARFRACRDRQRTAASIAVRAL
jgi:membrane protein